MLQAWCHYLLFIPTKPQLPKHWTKNYLICNCIWVRQMRLTINGQYLFFFLTLTLSSTFCNRKSKGLHFLLEGIFKWDFVKSKAMPENDGKNASKAKLLFRREFLFDLNFRVDAWSLYCTVCACACADTPRRECVKIYGMSEWEVRYGPPTVDNIS